MERAITFIPKVSIAVLEAALEGAFQGAFKALGPKSIEIMIDKDYYIVDSIFYAARHQPVYPPEVSQEQVARLEWMRTTMSKTVLPLLGMVRFVASKLPPEAVEAKVTKEWLLKKGREKFPEMIEIAERQGEKGERWLEKQAEEMRNYATGRLVWNEEERRMVVVAKKA